MTEKVAPKLPYPETDAVAEKFAADYAADKAHLRQLRLQDAQGSVGREVLKSAEADHANKNWLGRKLSERSMDALRSNVATQVNAFDLREGALTAIGVGLNIRNSRQHAREHLDEYVANGVELARADGVQIEIQQVASVAQPIEVHVQN